MTFDTSYILYLIKGLSLLVAAALILGVRVKPGLVWGLAAITGVLVVCVAYSVYCTLGADHRAGIDYCIFWKAGSDVWAGIDPYGADRFAELPFLNPPSVLPFFAAFALLPFPTSFLVWTLLNIVACAGLIALAQTTLTAQERLDGSGVPSSTPSWRLPENVLLGLTCALMLSDASLLTLALGQFSIMAAVFLLAALTAQARGRTVAAGALLALATVKVGTLLPFLLLFVRRADWRAWITLAVTTLGLCLANDRPGELPGRLTRLLERIKYLEAPGQVNDYSFEGTQPENILGFAHAFYRLGLRDRKMIRLAEYAAVLLLGVWVVRQVHGRGRLPRIAACSLVALYSTIFLYHRTYDTVILAIPLVYSAGQARVAVGPARWQFVSCALALLLVLNVNVDFLRTVTRLSLEWGVSGSVVQAVVLPYGTWLILLGMVLLVKGARLSQTNVTPSLTHAAEVAT
jgi:hypothetical protein